MSRPIRFGFQATGEHHQHIAESARRAEELGFDTFSVADHVPGGLSPMLALTAAAAAAIMQLLYWALRAGLLGGRRE